MLLKYLGINPTRKQNWFTNLFVAAYPREYRGILDGFKQGLDPSLRLKIDNATPTTISSRSSYGPSINGYSTGISLNGQVSGFSKTNGHTNGYSTGDALKGHNKSMKSPSLEVSA